MDEPSLEPEIKKDKRTILKLSSHYVEKYEVCPQYFDFNVNKGYIQKDENKAYTMGKLIHRILARYYTCIKEGIDIGEAMTNAIEYAESKLANEFDLSFEEIQFAMKTFRDYVGYYIDEKLITKVLEVERTFSKIIHEDDKIVIVFQGTPDLIFENSYGDPEIIDHKSESARRRTYGLNNQFLAYPFLIGITRMYRNAIGLQKTLAPADKFYREAYNFPMGKVEHWKNNVILLGKKIIESYKSGVWESHHSQCESNPMHRAGCIFQDVCRTTPINWELELEQSRELIKGSGLYY